MKSRYRKIFFLPALVVGLSLLPTFQVTAQTFKTLHSFTAGSDQNSFTNSDGARPYARLTLSGNTLYGTAYRGGSSDNGTVFKVNTNGTGFTTLHSFTAVSNSTNSDGASPSGGVILLGNTLFGTTSDGGSSGAGTVFKVNTNGTGFTTLHNFTAVSNATNSDGARPLAGLILSGNTLYGTTWVGGSSSGGTVFAINTDGTGFTNLHNFNYGDYGDGSTPFADLILSSNKLYGTTAYGGDSGNGIVFAINTDGTGFTNLHSFLVGGYNSSFFYTNSGGASPHAGIILSGQTLYGTASGGGDWGAGTVFAINTDGTGFTNLYIFGSSDGGAYPLAGLILSGNTLYGTASGGGSSSYGTIFSINTDGAGFTNLHSFTATSYPNVNGDGANPHAGLISSGNTLYGTAYSGGSEGGGTVFSLSFEPQLTIVPLGNSVVLTWPTNVAGFDYTGYVLQSAPAVTGTFTNIPGATNPYTNTITGSQKYFRLISN